MAWRCAAAAPVHAVVSRSARSAQTAAALRPTMARATAAVVRAGACSRFARARAAQRRRATTDATSAAAATNASDAAASAVRQLQGIATAQPSYKRLRDETGHRFYQFDAPGAKPLPSVTSVLSVIAKPALVAWSRNTALESVRASLATQHGAVLTKESVDRAVEAAKQHPNALFNKAADYGSRAHDAIEHVVLGTQPRPAVPKAVSGAVESFQNWWKGAALHTACAELVVHSERYGFAGQCDAIAVREIGRGGAAPAAHVAGPSEIAAERGSGDSSTDTDADAVSVAVFDWKTSSGLYPEYALQVAAYAKALEEMSGHSVRVREGWIVRIGRNGDGADFEVKRVRDLDAAFLTFRAALYLFNSIDVNMYDDARRRR